MPSRRIVRDIRVKRPEFITLLGGAAARPPNRHCASVFDQRCERIFARRLAYRGIGPSGVESRRIGV
jgi:hypothetical protein